MKQILTQQGGFFLTIHHFNTPQHLNPFQKKKKEKEKCTLIFFSFSWDILILGRQWNIDIQKIGGWTR